MTASPRGPASRPLQPRACCQKSATVPGSVASNTTPLKVSAMPPMMPRTTDTGCGHVRGDRQWTGGAAAAAARTTRWPLAAARRQEDPPMAHTVPDYMTAHPTVVEVTDSLRSVAQTMATQDVGALVVAENGAVVGIVTDRDLVVRGLAEGIGLDAPVGQLMTGNLTSVRPDDDVARLVQIMREEAVRRVPVVEGDRAVGIVTIGDLAQALDADSALADISAAPPND